MGTESNLCQEKPFDYSRRYGARDIQLAALPTLKDTHPPVKHSDGSTSKQLTEFYHLGDGIVSVSVGDPGMLLLTHEQPGQLDTLQAPHTALVFSDRAVVEIFIKELKRVRETLPKTSVAGEIRDGR